MGLDGGEIRVCSRRETFIILHMFGYRWRPRKKEWFVPKRPKHNVRVKVVS
jgi:hypothetical protein